jgi:hypothetical protein
MAGYGRTNTIIGNATSGAGAALTAKLPNQASSGGVIFAPAAGGTALPGISAVQRWRIKSVFAGYNGAAATGSMLTITDGVFTIIVPVGILNPIDLQCAAGAEVDLTLGAGATSILGFLTVIAEVE